MLSYLGLQTEQAGCLGRDSETVHPRMIVEEGVYRCMI